MRGMESHQTSVRKRRNREHHNSRNGCLQCKARKVKCDEEKPKCRSCTRRATPCTYTNNIGLNHLARAAQVSSPYNKPEPSSTFAPVPYNHGDFISNGNNLLQADGSL
ncbi:hypothetical protein HO173_004779 [Letharia columbiana]|uniref:Zn(2)-C6 fungal-type domain-containing protein n=1 Tax=Letharia columbiana TaxID=112416 RepID=A0A8H6FYL4_9LECA|nr:uncharacterized protein HO173_004779 [Letharia columbiana]KAF6237310.1 hypothetical protein HO173_004779 [Letharia columbiana]